MNFVKAIQPRNPYYCRYSAADPDTDRIVHRFWSDKSGSGPRQVKMTNKNRKKRRNIQFEVLDVLFRGLLQLGPPSQRSRDKCIAVFEKEKKGMIFLIVQFHTFDLQIPGFRSAFTSKCRVRTLIYLKCRIQIRIELMRIYSYTHCLLIHL